MKRAHINIGSNLGHRRANINSAVALLQQTVGKVTARSALIESEPWGYDSARGYLNCGVNVDTELDAAEILCRLKAIERTLAPAESHRTAAGTYADRHIDLDLIALGAETMATEELTLPHPAMHLRLFVLEPMAEIWPEWTHPALGLTPAEIIAVLGNNPESDSVMITYNYNHSNK